jgi:hypothetical protein
MTDQRDSKVLTRENWDCLHQLSNAVYTAPYYEATIEAMSRALAGNIRCRKELEEKGWVVL